MERKVGDVFECDGIKLKVVREKKMCVDCYFHCKSKCKDFAPIGGVIFVKVEDMEERTIKLSLEKAKEYYEAGGELRNIALQAFRKYEIIEGVLPKTWEEYLNIMFIDDVDRCNEAMFGYRLDTCRAYSKLRYLREYYRQGWEPDWLNQSQPKYYILENDGLEVDVCYCSRKFLCFQTQEIAEQFLENFRDIIIKADIL